MRLLQTIALAFICLTAKGQTYLKGYYQGFPDFEVDVIGFKKDSFSYITHHCTGKVNRIGCYSYYPNDSILVLNYMPHPESPKPIREYRIKRGETYRETGSDTLYICKINRRQFSFKDKKSDEGCHFLARERVIKKIERKMMREKRSTKQ